MNNDKLEGTVRNVGGKLDDAVGGLTGDSKTQMEGKFAQVAGTAQQMLGDIKQTAASAADDAATTVSGVADRVATTASDLGRDAYEKTADVAQNVRKRMQDTPFAVMIAAGLLGVAVGYVLGRPPHERAIQVGRARLAYRD